MSIWAVSWTQDWRLDVEIDLDELDPFLTFDFKAQIAGNYQKDLNSDTDRDKLNPNLLSLEGRQKDWGLYGRVGRQSRNSGGVFGRFDGFPVRASVCRSFYDRVPHATRSVLLRSAAIMARTI